jgi:hypothetical protein
MAAANLLTIGTNTTPSADLVVAVGTPVTVGLKFTTSDASQVFVRILLKDDLGAYWPIGSLDNNNSVTVISAPGTYAFVRAAGSGSVGVFSA